MNESYFLACSVCFGNPGSRLSHGLEMGVFVLLAIIGGVLASIVWSIIKYAGRAKRLERH